MDLSYKKIQKFIKFRKVYVLIIALSVNLHSNVFGHECGPSQMAISAGTSRDYTISGDHIADYNVTANTDFFGLFSITPQSISSKENGDFVISADNDATDEDEATIIIKWVGIKTDENPNPGEGECIIKVFGEGIPCPLSGLTEDDPQKKKKRGVLYDFRDKVLGQTSSGRHLTDLYYKHTNEVNDILIQYPDIFLKAKEMQKRFFPKILALSVGLKIKLTKDDIDDVIELLSTVKDYASYEFEDDILTFINDIEEEEILDQFRIEIDE